MPGTWPDINTCEKDRKEPSRHQANSFRHNAWGRLEYAGMRRRCEKPSDKRTQEKRELVREAEVPEVIAAVIVVTRVSKCPCSARGNCIHGSDRSPGGQDTSEQTRPIGQTESHE
ncbi:hypothetical protein TKK_0014533 [Trichogramma kaykai]